MRVSPAITAGSINNDVESNMIPTSSAPDARPAADEEEEVDLEAEWHRDSAGGSALEFDTDFNEILFFNATDASAIDGSITDGSITDGSVTGGYATDGSATDGFVTAMASASVDPLDSASSSSSSASSLPSTGASPGNHSSSSSSTSSSSSSVTASPSTIIIPEGRHALHQASFLHHFFRVTFLSQT